MFFELIMVTEILYKESFKMIYSKIYSEGVNYPNKFREILHFSARKLYLDISSFMNVSEEDN